MSPFKTPQITVAETVMQHKVKQLDSGPRSCTSDLTAHR